MRYRPLVQWHEDKRESLPPLGLSQWISGLETTLRSDKPHPLSSPSAAEGGGWKREGN
jgi:hypothetical protein